MNLELSGKVAVVTGSSRGIGFAIAQALHAQGCVLVLNGRQPGELAQAASGLPGALAVCADMTLENGARDLVAQALERHGRIDLLVCNVGSGRSVPPGQEDSYEWQRMLGLNLLATTNAVQAASTALQASRGSVVCISSICGVEVIHGAPVTYSAAKAALNAYVRGVARPLGKAGVRINAVAPGNILFPGSVWQRKLAENAAAVDAMCQREVALGRLGTPQDVADLVCYLASPRAAFVTGATWAVDGGQVHA